MNERIIIAASSKTDINEFRDDVNHEIQGKKIELNEELFRLFLRSNIVNEFFKHSAELIDDFETTIVENEQKIHILRKTIENAKFDLSAMNLKRELLQLVDYAIERRSGMVFFF